MSEALLSVRGARVRYGGVRAVDGVDLDVEDGSLAGLIGPNGAGKTTLIDAICGFCPAEGSIRFASARIDQLPAYRRSRLGLARTFQAGELFDDLTVLDNVMVGAARGSLRHAAAQVLRCRAPSPTSEVENRLAAMGLADAAGTLVRDLPVGLRKLVAVARALASGPRLVLLDEPAAGLDEFESTRLGEALLGLPRGGTTVVLVDHDMDLVLGICDVVHVLDTGRIIASGSSAEIRQSQAVREAYLGLPDAGPAR
jgi:ABC-type branched-subunit amino acid transport system ATPase component